MTRTDIHLDAMLRHLGAVYYDSQQGRAAQADVTRALGTVHEYVREQPESSAPGLTPSADLPRSHPRHRAGRVRDVMTTTVVTVGRDTPYKEIARLLADNRVSGVPVLSSGRYVVGMVTEADLLADEEKRAWERVAAPGHGPRQRWALTAGELMSAPAITIRPDATIAAAARTMNALHVRRLAVVGGDGCLLGIVSRRDLLSVFLRTDGDVATEVSEIFGEMLPDSPGMVTVAVKDGVVVLTGPRGADRDQVPVAVAIRMAWAVDGVVDIIDQRDTSPAATQPAAARQAPAPSESS